MNNRALDFIFKRSEGILLKNPQKNIDGITAILMNIDYNNSTAQHSNLKKNTLAKSKGVFASIFASIRTRFSKYQKSFPRLNKKPTTSVLTNAQVCRQHHLTQSFVSNLGVSYDYF
ncbi:hypothetical protein BHECKSOX2_532 [Bathymodiolus heckerae thiotrophic gill symbiont]|uniref:hypothetical protein n=1 Tax=Bathymodiolus heckerae thiotrophic gill symbiont TaxID=1052212 RepID=UPI0010B649AB|nr:hypothetical protein [Bathymodiolus heckerae thiotrophic gill symbiont]SMN13469.1 hypothetical protein BHECKSOX2_532 [Bathymodiolus heckerae thiotrophic gill symbiont]